MLGIHNPSNSSLLKVMIPMVTRELVVESKRTSENFPRVPSLPLLAKIHVSESFPMESRTQSLGMDLDTLRYSNSENHSLSSAEKASENQLSKEVTRNIDPSFHGDIKFLEVDEQSEEWSKEEEEEPSESSKEEEE